MAQSCSNNTTSSNWNFNEFCWYEDADNPEVYRMTLIIISIWIPLMLVGIYSLYSQVRRGNVPVYVINLLISDTTQICCMAVRVAGVTDFTTTDIFYYYLYPSGVAASIFFLTLITLERYLVIVWPLWYRYRKTTKVYVSVSVVSWILSIYIGISYENNLGGFLVLPLPFLVFFLVQTLRALSTAQSVSSDEKRRIVAVLLVVMVTYFVIFLARVTFQLVYWFYNDFVDLSGYTPLINIINVSCTLVQLNPLADIMILVFMKKWAFGNLLACTCCHKSQDMDNVTVFTCSGSVSQRWKQEENDPQPNVT